MSGKALVDFKSNIKAAIQLFTRAIKKYKEIDSKKEPIYAPFFQQRSLAYFVNSQFDKALVDIEIYITECSNY